MVKPYESSDFRLFESWVTDAALLLQFSGTDFTFPLTKQKIKDYQTMHPDRHLSPTTFGIYPFS